eukprot:3255317-Prymnesium_polylepis.1
MVRCHYEAWLMDGTKFENTRLQFGNPYIKLGGGMGGVPLLEQGLAVMNKGELAEFVAEAKWAYGAGGALKSKGVPPGASV